MTILRDEKGVEMTFQGETRYLFVSDAKPENTFAVVRFTGQEAVSQPYRFDIMLATEDSEIDLRAMLQRPARFVIHRADLDDRVFHGVLAEFEQMQESGSYVIYKAVLVPRLWHAGLYHENQLFLEKSVPDIVTEVLQQTQLTGRDYEFRLTASYNPWEYICQWRETDLNFIGRWMEREGIFFYFTQDEEREKLVITDSSTSHANISADHRIPYTPPSAMVPRNQEVIQSLVCRQSRLPNKVILRDYNYRRPSLELKAEAKVDNDSHGEVYFYGEHFKTPEEGNHLAQIRAEELLCRECMYTGESTAANLASGFLFNMEDHYRESYNQQYLILEVQHQGSQAVASFSGQTEALSDGEREMEYSNRFTAIPANIQFRPERKAKKPKFYGTLNATVDASGSGEYAEIDDQGRYKVVLPFDRSGNEGGRASRWIRMAQPYAGNDYGMHFPLHRGTEVLLTFVDGDPDRPIIAGSVPNTETTSPVNSNNQSQSMIRTGGGNQVRIEDQNGGQQIHLSSPTEGSIISLGAPNEGNLFMRTDGTSVMRVGRDSTRVISGVERVTIEQHSDFDVLGNENYEVHGDRTKRVGGKEKIFVDARQESYIKGGRVMQVSTGGEEYTVYDGQNQTIHTRQNVTVHGPQTIDIKGKQETKALGRKVEVTGAEEMQINGNRTLTVTGSESKTVNSEDGLNFASDNKMHYGFKNELFLGQKSDTNVAMSIEAFIGMKIARSLAIHLEANVGMKIENNDSLKLTSGMAEIKKINAPAIIKRPLTLLLG